MFSGIVWVEPLAIIATLVSREIKIELQLTNLVLIIRRVPGRV